MIITGGVNIYPAEIEAVLIAHPEVADVAVFGIPSEDLGEIVMALIQATSTEFDHDALRDSILTFCDDELTRYKQPRRLDFIK